MASRRTGPGPAPSSVPRRARAGRLAFAPPAIGEEEIQEVVDVLRSGWLTTGPRVSMFGAGLTRYLGAPATLCVNSGTAAMHVALAAWGIGPGDAVVTSTMTFASTVHVIEQLGARPVLVDVEPDTLNMSPTATEEALDRLERERDVRAAAVLPVHFAGHPCTMDTLAELADHHDLYVLEDAAHALPARYRGELVGSTRPTAGRGRAVAFSFYSTKNLTTGEGGALTGDEELVAEAGSWSLHGMTRDAWDRYDAADAWRYDVVNAGFKYNMTDLAAAIGLRQLEKLDGFHRRRREIAARYSQAFSACDALEVPADRSDVDHAWHLYVLRLRSGQAHPTRDEMVRSLAERMVSTSVHFIPVHMLSYYRDRYGFRPGDFPVARDAFERILSLPLHPALDDDDVDDVIEAVLDTVDGARG